MEKSGSAKKLIIIFYRNPIAGAVKTRLAAGIGADAALSIYKLLTARTLHAVQTVDSDKVVFYDREVVRKDIWSEVVSDKLMQSGQDLGARMANAFHNQFDAGYARILIIGTDCPDLTSELLERAFQQLETNDAVIGPALDGGYYLLGLKRPTPGVFLGIDWGSAAVFRQTMQQFANEGYSVALLDPLRDIDRPEDLHYEGGHPMLK